MLNANIFVDGLKIPVLELLENVIDGDEALPAGIIIRPPVWNVPLL